MTVLAAVFLSGICMATFAASGVFFLKFWKASRDPFYLHFSIACWLLAFERVVVVTLSYMLNLMTPEDESGSWIYIIRLVAFLIIFMAVLKKNQSAKKM